MCAALVLVTACGAPIMVRRDTKAARRQALSTVLTTGKLSRRTQNLLYDRDLTERYADDPAGAFAVLHADFVAGRLRPEAAAAIAELSFQHADHGGGSPYYLAAAVYAWVYLFPENPKDMPDHFTPRVRAACDLYNRGLTQGLKKSPDVVDLDGGKGIVVPPRFDETNEPPPLP